MDSFIFTVLLIHDQHVSRFNDSCWAGGKLQISLHVTSLMHIQIFWLCFILNAFIFWGFFELLSLI